MQPIAVDLSDCDCDFGDDLLSESDRELDERYQALVGLPHGVRTTFHSAADHGLPSRVVIGDRRFDVRAFFAGTDDWGGLLGSIDFDSGQVNVRVRERSGQRETMLHEVLHAVDAAAGTEAGESVVNAWAPVLLDALRRNAELTALLLSDDDET